MSRDYARKPRSKKAGTQRRRSAPAGRSSRGGNTSTKKPLPAWLWLLFGFSGGLCVAVIVVVFQVGSGWSLPSFMTSQSIEEDAEPDPFDPVEEQAYAVPNKDRGVTFYDWLPRYRIDPKGRVYQMDEPKEEGSKQYLIQAGSFFTPDDAERRKAQIAFLGIESDVVVAKASGRKVFRVLIGPYLKMDEVRDTTSILQDNDIESFFTSTPLDS